MDIHPFETAEASHAPTIRQFSIFLEDRVGQLVRLTRLFETTEIHILGMSVLYCVECAIIRLIVSDPDLCSELLSHANYPYTESEVAVVSVPPGNRGLLSIWSCLLGAEINVQYAYTLISRPQGRSSLVIQTENIEGAYRALVKRDFYVLTESDLRDDH